jgi:hypothetical protein
MQFWIYLLTIDGYWLWQMTDPTSRQRGQASEDGGDKFLRNVGWNSTDYTASYSRRWYSSKPPLWKPQILYDIKLVVSLFRFTHTQIITYTHTFIHKCVHSYLHVCLHIYICLFDDMSSTFKISQVSSLGTQCYNSKYSVNSVTPCFRSSKFGIHDVVKVKYIYRLA